MTTFEQVRPLADTVLYEGYVLYPYRADDAKNVVRWQFGVLAPQGYTALDPSERSALASDLLLEGRAARVHLRVRFLQVQRRTVHTVVDGASQQVPELRLADRTYLPFDEAVAQEVDLRFAVGDALAADVVHEQTVPGGVDDEAVDGGRLRRERRPVTVRTTVRAEGLPGPYGVIRLRLRVANATAWPGSDVQNPTDAGRPDALRSALVAAHVLARLEGGRFVSLTDPPEWASGYVRECHQEGIWPVLVGDEGSTDMVLCSPIILYDHPQVAPESTTAFFDATEMDEMLSLRTLTLTDDEKRAVRATDPRTADLIDQVETLPAELMDRLHGAVRYLSQRPRRVDRDVDGTEVDEPVADAVLVDGVEVRPGSHVLLRPGSRRADAQDIFLAGRRATVTRVLHDVDGGDHVAVVLDDDEGQDLAVAQGRYLYFAPDEVEPVGMVTT